MGTVGRGRTLLLAWHDVRGDNPMISFQDSHDWWQSGCQHALDDLVERGEISPPAMHPH